MADRSPGVGELGVPESAGTAAGAIPPRFIAEVGLLRVDALPLLSFIFMDYEALFGELAVPPLKSRKIESDP